MKKEKRLFKTLSRLILAALTVTLFLCSPLAATRASALGEDDHVAYVKGTDDSNAYFEWTITPIPGEDNKNCLTIKAKEGFGFEVEFFSNPETQITKIVFDINDQHVTEVRKVTLDWRRCLPVEEVEIPEGISSIGADAFKQWVNLKSITIPSTLLSIGDNAFCECTSLKDVDLQNVKYIVDQAFYMCSNLETVEANMVMVIGDEAFRDCKNLAAFDDTATVSSLGKKAFMGCENLSSFVVGSDLKEIKESTFEGCKCLALTGEGGITTYGYRALAGTDVRRLNLAETKTIGKEAFAGCTNLHSALFNHLDFEITSIGDGAFNGCTNLKWSTESADKDAVGLLIPGSVTSIGDKCFAGCTSLEKVGISEGTVNIGEHIFSGCNSLTNVIIPKTATGINEDALFYFIPEGTANVHISYEVASKLDLDKISRNVFLKFDYPGDVCGHKKEKGLVPRIKEAATCTEDGTGVYICRLCNADLDADDPDNLYVIKATGHLPLKDDRFLKSAATCTSPAVYYHNCGNCDCKLDTTYTSGKPAPHTYSRKKIQPATIMAAGKEYQVCTKCKAEKVNRVISQAFINCDDSVVYTGKAATPVKIIYANGRPINRSNYKITYKNNKAVGKATATINFKGDYANINNKPVTLSFYIVPKDKVPAYLNGFKVTPGKKEIKVAWKAIKKNVTGYQVQYALDKKFTQSVKTITIKKSSTASTTIKKLKPNTSYYVRVRAFNKVGKVYAYSPKWTTLGKAYKVK